MILKSKNLKKIYDKSRRLSISFACSLLLSSTLFANNKPLLPSAEELRQPAEKAIHAIENMLTNNYEFSKIGGDYFNSISYNTAWDTLAKTDVDPNILLTLCLRTAYDSELRTDLAKLVLKSGADLNNIKYPMVVEALKNNQQLFPRLQNIIRGNLKLFLTNLADEEEDDDEGKADLLKRAKQLDNDGHCGGLTLFWLYSKWLQFTQPKIICDHPQSDANSWISKITNYFFPEPERHCGYTDDWFNKTVTTIVSWDGKSKLDNEQIKSFQGFFAIVDFLQQPNTYRAGLYQLNYRETHPLSMLASNGKELKLTDLCVKDKLNLTLQEFTNLLKEKVTDDKLVDLVIQFDPEDEKAGYHANGLFKHGEKYYYYEPNEVNGEYADTSIEKIAEIIFNRYSNSKGMFKIYGIYTHEFV